MSGGINRFQICTYQNPDLGRVVTDKVYFKAPNLWHNDVLNVKVLNAPASTVIM